MAATTTRVNISFRKDLYKDLKKFVPKRKYSAFVNDAVEERLRREESHSILKAPKLLDKIDDPVGYVRKMREADDPFFQKTK